MVNKKINFNLHPEHGGIPVHHAHELQVGSSAYAAEVVRTRFNGAVIKEIKPFCQEYGLDLPNSNPLNYREFNRICFNDSGLYPTKYLFFGDVTYSIFPIVSPPSPGIAQFILYLTNKLSNTTSTDIVISDTLHYNGLETDGYQKHFKNRLISQMVINQTGFVSPRVCLTGFLIQVG